MMLRKNQINSLLEHLQLSLNIIKERLSLNQDATNEVKRSIRLTNQIINLMDLEE